MRVLIVGSGGREHALAWKIRQSPRVERLFIAPGNGGTALEGENVAVDVDDIPGLVKLARTKKVDLVIVGPELPLVLGLTDALEKENILCFGPGAYPAQLEGSKAFAKSLMSQAEVPTAGYRVFEDFNQAVKYVQGRDFPVVIKADGLAAGKGVVVADDFEQAREALDDMLVKQVFGKAGERVVIEEALSGEEASFLALCDGRNFLLLPSSQDHKRIGENDTGPNTGGMGAYSPAPVLPAAKYQETADLVIRPMLQHLEQTDQPFKGVLYAGLIFSEDGPRVLEYNVRFGDPECQPLLMRLDSDLLEVIMACVHGRAAERSLQIKDEASVCVVLSAGGYPARYTKGHEITGIEEAETDPLVRVFHAGTAYKDGRLVTSGGRVLGVTALGTDLGDAIERCYRAVEKISFEGMYYRRDIGQKGL
ncbi:phosphoribosylamine/glycine ligase [Desulfonatronospira thiodismutans ASO3-1]|uniref:Phosphoribosylamine--glycine ligase n=2 Tax=Desulfonatronospira TaxID=488937 RepID=D6SS67_9BACT|nr:phosphoribosylamine--glycine ligase [Desulfonatronospira thiodismutans]EFI33533.1 phosphoribosylamine/glycine ligase [Desulfonatronospira thiodismutans ASO3-1]